MMKKENTTKTMSYDFGSVQNERIIPVSGDLFSGADLGQKPVKKPVVVFTAPFACTRCGQFFTDLVRVGRPQRFCSDECRHDTGVEQRREWKVSARSESEDRPTHCQQCGTDLPVGTRQARRFRRFCSTRCLKKSRNMQRVSDLFAVSGFGDIGGTHGK